jgi:inner membrane protein
VASFFSHPAFPVAMALSSMRAIPKKLLELCLVLTLLPDLDVLAFKLGIPYASPWGHRGFTHSIVFALITGVICSLFSSKLGASKKRVFWWSFSSILSHSLFDALTNGGLGVAFFWPLDSSRYFLPWRPVEVSPIGIAGFLSWRGVAVVASEILWIWLPCLIFSFVVRYFQRRQSLPNLEVD